MKKIAFSVLYASVLIVQSPVDALPSQSNPSHYTQLQQNAKQNTSSHDTIHLLNGEEIKGEVISLPSMQYPFGSIQLNKGQLLQLSFSEDNGAWKAIGYTKDGTHFVAHPDHALVEIKSPEGQQKSIRYSEIQYINFSLAGHDATVKFKANPHVIEFGNETLLPVDFGNSILVVNDGQKDLTLKALYLIDVRNERGLHGIILGENKELKHVPLAIVKDEGILVKTPFSDQIYEILWRDIVRVYEPRAKNKANILAIADTDSQDVPAPKEESLPIPPPVDNPKPNPPPTTQPPTLNKSFIAMQDEALIITPVLTEDGSQQFKVIGRISPKVAVPAGAAIGTVPTDIALIGENITYDPTKKIKDDEPKVDPKEEFHFSAKEKDNRPLKADGGAIRKPALAERALLREEPVAMAEEIPPPPPPSTDPLKDEHGYYIGEKKKVVVEPELSEELEDPDMAGMYYVPSQTVQEGDRVLNSFYIDKYAVTNKQYYRFVKATNYQKPKTWPGGRIPKGQEHLPVVGITYDDASAYAQWAGKRLPTDVEWCRACKEGKLTVNTRKTLREWTSTPFAPQIASADERAWNNHDGKEFASTPYKTLRTKDQKVPIPHLQSEPAHNIGFRTVLEVEE